MTELDAYEQCYKSGFADGMECTIKHGHWIYDNYLNLNGDRGCICSRCKAYDEHHSSSIGNIKYCCNCGACMDEGDVFL